jgi:hypothetical protein
MALHFKTDAPQKLLSAYKKAIDDGHIKTWSYDQDGDFTHSTEQWIRQAWLRPEIKPGSELVFYILAPKETELTSEAYAVYHGRFIESMLRHCDSLFVHGYASAMPEDGDML